MKQTIALAAILAAVALPASAEYTVKGSVECPDIVKEDGNEHYREYNKWWLLGYFTARNYAANQEVGQLGEVEIAGRETDFPGLHRLGEGCDLARLNPRSPHPAISRLHRGPRLLRDVLWLENS